MSTTRIFILVAAVSLVVFIILMEQIPFLLEKLTLDQGIFPPKFLKIMAAPKYKEFYDLMIKQNKEDFDAFEKIHANYIKVPKKWQVKFNESGWDIQDIIRDYENRLCRQSEGAGNSKFTTALAAKFHAEVKSHFPKIDFIGLE